MLYKLPILGAINEGAWTQIKNNSVFTITINDSNNLNVSVIAANSVGEYVSSPNGWIDYSVIVNGVIQSNTNITGYLNVGSAGPPANTTAGDITGTRVYTKAFFMDDLTLGNTYVVNGGTHIETLSATFSITSSAASFRTSNNGNPAVLNITSEANSINGLLLTGRSSSPTVIVDCVSSATDCGILYRVKNAGTFQVAASGASVLIVQAEANSINGLTITGRSSSAFILIDCTSTAADCGVAYRIKGSSNFQVQFSGIAALQVASNASTSNTHFQSSAVLTIAAGVGAGTSPTISISSNDHGCRVSLTTGTGPTTGTIFTITFGASWSGTPQTTFSPANAATAALSGTSAPFIGTPSTTNITLQSGTVALAASTAYVWTFVTCK